MLRVEDLSYSINGRLILEGLSFELSLGDCVALVGKNGSGKTTTMNIVAGCLRPTTGQVIYNGKLGYAMDQAAVYADMTVEDYLFFIGRLQKMDTENVEAAVEAALDALDLKGVAARLIGRLSKGYTQRVGLAQSILNSPDILILDEPTSGLDPEQQQQFASFIRQFLPSRLVVLSTHRMDEVTQWCNRVLVLSDGRIREVGTEEVTHAMGLDFI